MNKLANLLRLGASVCSVAALPWLGPLQQSTGPGDQETPQIRVTQVDESEFPKVKLYVSVTDAAGEPVGISPDRLVLSENGQTLQPDLVSGQGEIGPLTTLLIVDVSGSMNEGSKLEAAKMAARAYIDQMRPGDQAGLVAFNTEITYVQPLTTDRLALGKAIDGLMAKQDTAMYDALARGTELLADIEGRKAIIVLTDGLDNRSINTVDQVIEQVGPSGLSISTVGLGDTAQLAVTNAGLDESVLMTLAERAGGSYGFAGDPDTLLNLYQRLGRALQSEYVITFTAPNALRDGVNRNLIVTLADADVSAQAAYNPGGLVPEVPQSNTWPLFGLALIVLLALLFVPVLAKRGLAAARGLRPMLTRKKAGRIRLHKEPQAPSKPRIHLH